MSRARIITSCWAKPFPDRRFDWEAYYDGDEPNDDGAMLCGYGATEQDAIDDLLCTDPDDAVARVSDALALGDMAPEEAEKQLRRAGVDDSEIDDLIATALHPSGRPIERASESASVTKGE